MQFPEPTHCITAFDFRSIVASVSSDGSPNFILRLVILCFTAPSNAHHSQRTETTRNGAAYLFIYFDQSQ
jgi:hypothetical protein